MTDADIWSVEEELYWGVVVVGMTVAEGGEKEGEVTDGVMLAAATEDPPAPAEATEPPPEPELGAFVDGAKPTCPLLSYEKTV